METQKEFDGRLWTLYSAAALRGLMAACSFYDPTVKETPTIFLPSDAASNAAACADAMVAESKIGLLSIDRAEDKEIWIEYAAAALSGIIQGCSGYNPEWGVRKIFLPTEAAAWARTTADAMFELQKAKKREK